MPPKKYRNLSIKESTYQIIQEAMEKLKLEEKRLKLEEERERYTLSGFLEEIIKEKLKKEGIYNNG